MGFITICALMFHYYSAYKKAHTKSPINIYMNMIETCNLALNLLN